MDRLERLVRLAEAIQERDGCDFDEASQRAGDELRAGDGNPAQACDVARIARKYS